MHDQAIQTRNGAAARPAHQSAYSWRIPQPLAGDHFAGLNNAPGVRSIPQETRDRVTEAAAKFDYRPSFFARSLRKRQTFTVGVLVPELSDSYATQVLAASKST